MTADQRPGVFRATDTCTDDRYLAVPASSLNYGAHAGAGAGAQQTSDTERHAFRTHLQLRAVQHGEHRAELVRIEVCLYQLL